MTQAERWRQAGLKSWATRRHNAAGQALVETVESGAEPPPQAANEGVADWRPIKFADIPTRDEFVALTLDLLQEGFTNSDRMRDAIRRQRKLILTDSTGNWNESPSDKYVNEHAWALKYLIEQGIVELVATKEYRLLG